MQLAAWRCYDSNVARRYRNAAYVLTSGRESRRKKAFVFCCFFNVILYGALMLLIKGIVHDCRAYITELRVEVLISCES